MILPYRFNTGAYINRVGIVKWPTKTKMVAIEGNTALTSNDNGGAVM